MLLLLGIHEASRSTVTFSSWPQHSFAFSCLSALRVGTANCVRKNNQVIRFKLKVWREGTGHL